MFRRRIEEEELHTASLYDSREQFCCKGRVAEEGGVKTVFLVSFLNEKKTICFYISEKDAGNRE